jgi:hypothetical protein
MRDDLTEALAAVQWADTHIPVMNRRFIIWKQRGPYDLVVEPDPEDATRELLVAYLNAPLDSLIHGDIGAIINSMRTALDILMSALLTGHGIKPNSKAHFPVRSTEAEFLTSVATLESRKWISAAEAVAIKRTKAYKGGDRVLYSIHQLDILRKHERLLAVEPIIRTAHLAIEDEGFHFIVQHMDDKTILYSFPRGRFRPTKSNSQIAPEIYLNEPTVGVTRHPAILALRAFTSRIRNLIEYFP